MTKIRKSQNRFVSFKIKHCWYRKNRFVLKKNRFHFWTHISPISAFFGKKKLLKKLLKSILIVKDQPLIGADKYRYIDISCQKKIDIIFEPVLARF